MKLNPTLTGENYHFLQQQDSSSHTTMYSLKLEKNYYAHFPSSRIPRKKEMKTTENLNTQQSSQFPSQKAHQSTRFS